MSIFSAIVLPIAFVLGGGMPAPTQEPPIQGPERVFRADAHETFFTNLLPRMDICLKSRRYGNRYLVVGDNGQPVARRTECDQIHLQMVYAFDRELRVGDQVFLKRRALTNSDWERGYLRVGEQFPNGSALQLQFDAVGAQGFTPEATAFYIDRLAPSPRQLGEPIASGDLVAFRGSRDCIETGSQSDSSGRFAITDPSPVQGEDYEIGAFDDVECEERGIYELIILRDVAPRESPFGPGGANGTPQPPGNDDPTMAEPDLFVFFCSGSPVPEGYAVVDDTIEAGCPDTVQFTARRHVELPSGSELRTCIRFDPPLGWYTRQIGTDATRCRTELFEIGNAPEGTPNIRIIRKN
ncbi:MAG: hypothetical protein AAFR35_11485 [Pseudomonadota bacterium]